MSKENPLLARLRQLIRRQEAASDLPPAASITVPEEYKDLGQRLREDVADAAAATEKQGATETAVDVVFLRQALLNHLTPADLAAVAAAAGLDWDDYSGGKGRKVQVLLADCERQGRVAALLTACRARQPDVSWQPDDA